MNRRTWKKGEQRIASIFGCRRTPLSGGNSGHTRSDTLHPRLFLEVRHRARIPCNAWWQETKRLASLENKLPVLVLLEKGRHDPLVMCSIHDLRQVAKEIVVAPVTTVSP